MVRNKIIKILKDSTKRLGFNQYIKQVSLEYPENKDFGDYSTNVAMQLAGKIKSNPLEIADKIIQEIENIKNFDEIFAKVELVKPGFINFFLSKEFLASCVAEILQAGTSFGNVDISKKEKILLEFISANPTGPLTIANGRGGFGGDVLGNILYKAGYDVSREYYINDAGLQIQLLGKSIKAAAGMLKDQEEFYHGDYIIKLAKQYPQKIKQDDYQTGKNFAKIILANEIKPVVKKMGIRYNSWFSENELYQSGEIDKTLKYFKQRDLTYEKDGAVWLKTSKFGDDKDRVLKKSEAKGGEPTYLLPDIAYHKNKFERGYVKLIDIMGADHHGYIPRLKIGVEVLGLGNIDVILTQLVKLVKNGKEIRMSKRKGNYELISDLIEEVGLDSVRWFFIARDWNSHLVFDMDLAKEKSENNPVYYVQYAHARICSILAKAKIKEIKKTKKKLIYTDPNEINLINELIKYPELIMDIANRYEVHRLPIYALEIAKQFHVFYNHCRVIEENNDINLSRLALVISTKIILNDLLTVMGISAPEKM